MTELDDIATRWGTDKASWGHDYCAVYEQFFEPLRHQPITLLEIGWGSGCSAAAWREYFTSATIAVIDNNFDAWPIGGRVPYPTWPTPIPEPPPNFWRNVYRYKGDQASPELVEQVVAQHDLFDIVIDDASHMIDKTLGSFALLWPHVAPGGFYAIEDVAAYGGFDESPDSVFGEPADLEWVHIGEHSAPPGDFSGLITLLIARKAQ